MKKVILASLAIVAVALMPSVAGANHPVEDLVFSTEMDQNINIKVEICHWASGNISEPDVNINAVLDAQDTGHGLLTLTATGSLGSFVAHTETGGHEKDVIARIYLKHGNSEKTLYARTGGCGDEQTTTTTIPDETTTTTVVETTTSTVPTVTVPTDWDCPQLSFDEAQNLLRQDPSDPFDLDADGDGVACEPDVGTFVSEGPHGGPAPGDELPRTGAGVGLLAAAGAALTAGGAAIRRHARRRQG